MLPISRISRYGASGFAPSRPDVNRLNRTVGVAVLASYDVQHAPSRRPPCDALAAAQPGFTAVAVLTFALGIGVNTAVFSVFNGVLLRPLPYPEADRITMVWMDNRGRTSARTSRPIRTTATGGSGLVVRAARRLYRIAFNLTGADEPERLNGAQATANFFDVMGVRPLLGRVFTEAHETPGNDAVGVISHGLWQRGSAARRTCSARRSS